MTRIRKRANRAPALKPRRGIALFVAMFFVAGIGALALSAIYLTANATLLSKTYEKEDDLKYISEAALQIGKAELNFNPAALPQSGYVTLMNHKILSTADNQTVPGITVNLYAGPTGSTSGQFGRFASIVAEARDANNTGFVRRLELTQESFAKFAYWTNSENNASGGTIVFANGDALWGPVWSNDTININSSGASFHDDVGTAAPVIVGASYGTFSKGYQVKQKPITLPSLTTLSSLSSLATAGGMNFSTTYTGGAANVLMRIEFVATDLNADGDSTDDNEGFFRVYKATSGNDNWLRADWTGTTSALPATGSSTFNNCGDWHVTTPGGPLKFFPWATHVHSVSDGHGGYLDTWFDTVVANGLTGGIASTSNHNAVHNEADSVTAGGAKFTQVLQTHTNLRCYLGGDPHLVAVARTTGLGYTNAQIHKGGEDSTFTATDQFGAWQRYSTTPPTTVNTKRPYDAQYLFPLYRGYNTSTKGVIYVSGTVGISGVLRGDITLYTPNSIVYLDDVRYANDPANGVCIDILGTISGQNSVVADNAINTPQPIKVTSPVQYRSFDDSPSFDLQDVVMALNTSFSVENYDQGPTSAVTCGTTSWGRGCLNLTGGLIQNNRGPVGVTSGTGYIKRYSYDRCAVVNPPPYFPTTGRFLDNRYYEYDPVAFNITSLFNRLVPH